MERMKTFLLYLIIFIGFYMLSNALISVALATSYEYLECTKNESNSYVVQVAEAKATSVSGYVKGTIKLNEGIESPEKYLQVDLYSKYGHCVGRRFVDLSSVKSGEQRDFKVSFECDNVATYEITTTNDVERLDDVQANMVSKGYFAITLVGALMVLYYVL